MAARSTNPTQLLLATACVGCLTAVSHSQLTGQPMVLLRDDFENGFSLDWQDFGPPGSTFGIVNGGAVITPGGSDYTGLEINGFEPNNFSILTQVSLSERTASQAFPYVFAYSTQGAGNIGLWAGISSTNLSLSVGDVVNGIITTRETENVGLDVVANPINFQVDFIAPALRFKAWAEGTEEPFAPQIVLVDERFRERDQIALGLSPSGNLESVRWEWFEVREPPLLERTDFDFDGTIDSDDINQLCGAVARDRLSNPARFDLNADSTLDLNDITAFLMERGLSVGDTDLDGQVTFEDFLALSANYGRSSGLQRQYWDRGDFDCNGEIGFSDFLLLSANFTSPGQALAVPEPSYGAFVLTSALVFRGRRRLRKTLEFSRTPWRL